MIPFCGVWHHFRFLKVQSRCSRFVLLYLPLLLFFIVILLLLFLFYYALLCCFWFWFALFDLFSFASIKGVYFIHIAHYLGLWFILINVIRRYFLFRSRTWFVTFSLDVCIYSYSPREELEWYKYEREPDLICCNRVSSSSML